MERLVRKSHSTEIRLDISEANEFVIYIAEETFYLNLQKLGMNLHFCAFFYDLHHNCDC
jgi:hypothetical protein